MKNFFVKKWKLIAIILVVLAGGLFIYFKSKSTVTKTASVERGDLKEEMTLSGEITATNYAKLSFETSGKVAFVGVKEGEKVNKGRVISKLDSTVLNSSYQIAMSNLRAAEATVENIHNQVKDHSSDETYVQKDLRTTAEANKDKAYEAMIQAKRNLDGATLYAPFNGIVTYLAHPFTGVYTTLGATEAEIIDPSTMYLNVLADQTEVTKIKRDQKVKIVLDSFDGKEFEGVVSNISFTPRIGETSSVYSVKVMFTNVDLSSSSFKIAMTGDARFVTSEKGDVLFVPNNFVKQDKQGSYVKVDTKGKKVYVKTGIESEDSTEIIGDVKEGQVVYD
jgi:RND family efflux transporter MFP subunit